MQSVCQSTKHMHAGIEAIAIDSDFNIFNKQAHIFFSHLICWGYAPMITIKSNHRLRCHLVLCGRLLFERHFTHFLPLLRQPMKGVLIRSTQKSYQQPFTLGAGRAETPQQQRLGGAPIVRKYSSPRYLQACRCRTL